MLKLLLHLYRQLRRISAMRPCDLIEYTVIQAPTRLGVVLLHPMSTSTLTSLQRDHDRVVLILVGLIASGKVIIL